MQKMGLGSSAAVTVAFTVAMRRQLGVPNPADPDAVYRVAQEVHHGVQGMGSGADIAAATFGGALRYRWFDAAGDPSLKPGETAHPCLPGTGICSPLNGGLDHIIVAWTGRSASTRNLVAAVHQARARCPRQYASIMRTIEESSQLGQVAWSSRDRTELITAAEQGRSALVELGELAGVSLVTSAHQKLQDRVSGLGAIVKPTGAGGGDLAWIIAPSSDSEDRLLQCMADEKIPAWRLSIPSVGSTIIEDDRDALMGETET